MEKLIKQFAKCNKYYWTCYIWWLVGAFGAIIGLIFNNKNIYHAGSVLMWIFLILLWIFSYTRIKLIKKIKELKNKEKSS